MFITGAFSSCTRRANSDNDDHSSKQDSDKDDDSSIVAPHSNEKIFYFDRFHRKKETQTKMTFSTQCPVLPSSWKIIVDLTVSNVFDNIHLLITMIRTDFGLIPIEGIIHLWFLNSAGKTCPISYCVNSCMPFRVQPSKYDPFTDISRSVHETFFVDEHFRCLFKENDDQNYILPDDLLILKIQLFVKGCCDCKKKHLVLEDTSKIYSEEGTRDVSTEAGLIRRHSADENQSGRHSGYEGPSRRHSGDEGPSRKHSGDEGPSKRHSGEEDPSRRYSGEESPMKYCFRESKL